MISLYSDLNLKPEEELILYCARTYINSNTNKKINELIKGDLEWDYFIDLASFHSLRSLLYFQLSQICPEKVPNHIMDQLKEQYNSNGHRNLLMIGELFKIHKIMESEGIKVIPYKGPVLADKIYGNLSLREFADLDIFIDKNDVIKVKEILISLGYEPKLHLNKKNEPLYLKIQREYQFINKKSGVSVEIQWNLADISLSFPNEPVFTMDQIETELIEINNKEISVFSDEDLLLILSLHTVPHLWSRLSWICDISELVKNSPEFNWDKVEKKSQKLAIERIVYLNLSLARELFDIELPKDIIDKIESDNQIKSLKQEIMIIIFDPEDYGFVQSFFLRFKIREKLKDKIKDFLKLLIIPTSTEWKTFQKLRCLKILYVLIRPVQIFNKIVKQ